LAITVLATIMLYYELYVGGSVSTFILQNLHMSFTFFVVTLAFGNLIGAFGSLFAGLTDRLGRANLVVFGLLFTGVFVAFVLPAATDKWVFTIEGFVVGVVEGICLVATPALIRDFSPQVGRATAMGFWTSGPVLGSLIVFLVASWTIPPNATDPHLWTREYLICGIAGLVVFLIALIGLRELSPQLRDQLMVTMRDRALIEARAKGIDIEAALRHPFRQLLKPDVLISAFAVSVMLIIYYTAVGFAVIFLTTVFGMSVHTADALGNWNWGFNAIAVILIGIISDRVRVRKPFMVIGGAAAAVMTVIYLLEIGLQPGYYTLAIILALLSFALGVAYTPWMASFTETVEAHNPALTATGLAIWGWIIRVVVFASFMLIPVVINTVTPLVNYGGKVLEYSTKYPAFTFAAAHPDIVAKGQKYSVQAANAQRLAPELAALQKDVADVGTVLGLCATPNKVPKQVMTKAVAAAGGGTTGQGVLTTMCQNAAAINGIIKVQGPLQSLKPFASQLTALQKIPKPVVAYMTAHGAAVQKAKEQTVGQWKTWYWICFGGIVFFLCTIPLMRGRWRPSDARRDEEEHEAMVERELAALKV
jgi:MFS family permease